MKKSESNVRPQVLEKHANGVHVFRWGIEEKTREAFDGQGEETFFEYYEMFVQNGGHSNTNAACIEALWGGGVEQKLTNDYLAAKEGVFTGEKAEAAIAAYKEFLTERQALKDAVDEAYNG